MGMARNGSKPINSYHSWGNKHPIHQLFWGSIQVPQNFTEKKKIGRDTAVVDHHSGKPGARLPIRGDSWEAKNGGCMAVDTRPGNLTVYRGFNGDLMGFYSDSMGY